MEVEGGEGQDQEGADCVLRHGQEPRGFLESNIKGSGKPLWTDYTPMNWESPLLEVRYN